MIAVRVGALAALLGLGGCAGAASSGAGHPTVLDDPMSVAENQQGVASVAAEIPVTSAPLPNTYIWCADSAGMACRRVTAALGAVPVKVPERAPPALFDLEDLPDDCTAVGMLELRTRIERALSLASSGWRDQGGNRLEAAYWPNVYSAAGCIADSASPVVKIAASSSATPRLYLVRVWETDAGY